MFSAQRAHLRGLSANFRQGLIASENNLCRNLYLMGRHEECIALARSVMAREAGQPANSLPNLSLILMLAQINARHIDDARQTLSQALPGCEFNRRAPELTRSVWTDSPTMQPTGRMNSLNGGSNEGV